MLNQRHSFNPQIEQVKSIELFQPQHIQEPPIFAYQSFLGRGELNGQLLEPQNVQQLPKLTYKPFEEISTNIHQLPKLESQPFLGNIQQFPILAPRPFSKTFTNTQQLPKLEYQSFLESKLEPTSTSSTNTQQLPRQDDQLFIDTSTYKQPLDENKHQELLERNTLLPNYEEQPLLETDTNSQQLLRFKPESFKKTIDNEANTQSPKIEHSPILETSESKIKNNLIKLPKGNVQALENKTKVNTSSTNTNGLLQNSKLNQNILSYLENVNNGAVLQNDKPLFIFRQELKTVPSNDTKNENQTEIINNVQRSEEFQTFFPTYTQQVLIPIVPVVPIETTTEMVKPEKTSKKDKITLILKPISKAIAGLKGTAIASPFSRAVLDEDTDVDVYYYPEAVAIAGPGGIAHAQSELEVGYFRKSKKN